MDNKGSSLQQLGFAWFALVKDQVKLFQLESKLAQLSLTPLLISGAALFFIAITLWFSINVLICYGFYLGFHNILFSIIAIVVLNTLAACLAIFMLLKYKNRMRFEHTRAALKEYIEP
jgi:uncharacterized membrane protein YqjE